MTVQATDEAAATRLAKRVTVTVTNVEEAGTVRLSRLQPQDER